jgi:dephospho-CoA kinase
MIIIGITGTLGAGKGTVVEYLEIKGFAHYSMSGFIIREIERRGLPVNRDNMVVVGNDLRAAHSPSYIAETLYDEAAASGKNAVIESLRTEGEIAALRAKGNFLLFAIDANSELRYQRVAMRGSSKDNISFEKFLADETREMHATDPNKQNLARCIELADYRLMNNGTFDELRAEVDAILRNKIHISAT